MDAAWKTVRVFISSTFRDMQSERDHLVRFVFPLLREELVKRRIHLIDVDLRWGVTSEQNCLEVCHEIIDECRPRFLCMLGGRYGWVPPGNTCSITADEVHFGVLSRALDDRGYAYFYFRDDASTASMVETTSNEFREPQGSEDQDKLSELKQAIVAAGLKPFVYSAQWDDQSRRLTGLKHFGDRVYQDLLDSIKSDAELQDRFADAAPTQLDEFTEENASIEAFVQERTEGFVLGSREAVLNELLAHSTATDGNNYVCLVGAPGSGKSALLARLSQHPALNAQPETLLICHFVGASPGASDLRLTLRRLCHELKAGCLDIVASIPDDPQQLRVAFPDFLRQASAHKRVVILLDAVNQFDPASSSPGLYWLPDDLPANVRVILSALDGPALKELRRRPDRPREIKLPLLTTADSEAIIDRFLQRYQKNFELDQRALLLTKTDISTPLYLQAALEELRTLGTYEEITRRIAELPPTTDELFAWILQRLENDDGFRDASGRLVGHDLVSRFAALLGASRYGLSQRELVDMLDPGDPQGNTAALLRLLRPYLMRRGELLDLYHDQFRASVKQVHLKTNAQRRIAHTQLADYFQRAELWLQPIEPKGSVPETARPRVANLRKLEELPWQTAHSGRWHALIELVRDWPVIECYESSGRIEQLLGDIQFAMELLVSEQLVDLSAGVEGRLYWIQRFMIGRDIIASFFDHLRYQHNAFSFEGYLPPSMFETRVTEGLRNVFQGRATSSAQLDIFRALLMRDGVSDRLLFTAAVAFAKVKPVEAWQLAVRIHDDSSRLLCLRSLLQIADPIPPDLILAEAGRISEDEPPRNRGAFLAHAVRHLLCLNAREFRSRIYPLFCSDSELLPLVHYFRALPPAADDQRTEIVHRLLFLSIDHSGPYESSLFFESAIVLSRRLPYQARLEILSRAEECIPGQETSSIWERSIQYLVAEYASLKEFEKAIGVLRSRDWKSVLVTGFAIVAALVEDDTVAKALLARIPAYAPNLREISLPLSDFPWPFNVDEPHGTGQPYYGATPASGAVLAVLYGELHRRFATEITLEEPGSQTNSEELRLDGKSRRWFLRWLPMKRQKPTPAPPKPLNRTKTPVRDKIAKIEARLNVAQSGDHDGLQSWEQLRESGLDELMQSPTLPEWCELASTEIQVPTVLVEESAAASPESLEELWHRSRTMVRETFEQHWAAVPSPSTTHLPDVADDVPDVADDLPEIDGDFQDIDDDSPDIDEPIVSRTGGDDQVAVDVETLRVEVEALSQLKQTLTGRGFHDQSMMKHMAPILRKLYYMPQPAAIELGERLIEIMRYKWYDRHEFLSLELVQLASRISADLGIHVAESFHDKRLPDYEQIRLTRITACQTDNLVEAIELLLQLRSVDAISSGHRHVAVLLSGREELTVPICEGFALSLARLSHCQYAEEAFRVTAAVARHLEADQLESFGKILLHNLRLHAAHPDPECWDELIPVLLQRSPISSIPALLVEFTFPFPQLAGWRALLPDQMRSALRRAFDDELMEKP